MSSTLSTASLVSDVTTCAETASMGEATVTEALGNDNAASKPRALKELLGLSGLCDLLYFGSHAFAFMGYAPVMPRQDLEYELRLLAPPVTMKAQLQKVVALIRENKRIKLVHGPRERECCHGWIRASQEEEIAQILCELDQLRLVSTNGNPQDTQKKQAKVMATVLCLETIGTAEIERDKSVLQQTHALDNEVGGFISAAFDTRNLLTERGLVGLLEWKVVLV